ncbi:MAG: hypothetical protein CFE23_11700 [Flavobacterium sp. BFFFF1]|uniref:hypothetical protein n=1 Tax=unclassified Flavobacterium TaxID=196869 RepID=UPI000BD6180D|nr:MULTISPECIES: hypothetical protein [unclassified Flavobacterium]OYU79913.1 MAG: hypothetical protein CFE23_11700 [Flavobacterium sp. BFFFF1]
MSTYENVFSKFEQGFLGSCALGILVQSCAGGIAAMAILENGNGLIQMIQLFLVVIVCLAFNGAVISVQKHKTIFNLLIVGLLSCAAIAAINFAHV